MRHLPVISSGADAFDPLDRIEIPIPCHVPWDSMLGDDRIRRCGECRLDVHNVAAYTRPEASRLLSSRAGRVCLRIYRRPDGTVLTSDCRERLRAARRRGRLVFAGALLVVLWAQICAQVVGLVGLRRVLGRAVQGSPSASGIVAPRPADPPRFFPGPTAGVPRLPPTLGKPAPARDGHGLEDGIVGRIKVRAKGGRSPRE